MTDNGKLAHLGFVQGAVNRMAGDSFLVKGWSVTLVTAIVALAAKGGGPCLILVAYPPTVVFWLLDAHFLRLERLYRKLYDTVRMKQAEDIDFSMDTSVFDREVASFRATMFSRTLVWFHGILLVFITGALVIAMTV